MYNRRVLKTASLAVLILAFWIAPAPAQTRRNRPAAEHLFIKCGTLIDPATESIRKDCILELVNGKILRLLSSSAFQPAAEDKVLDFNGKFVIPGLIDTHAHLYGGVAGMLLTNEAHAPLYLSCGVTAIRTPGSMNPEGDLALRDRINAGTTDGPRLFVSGAYVEADPVTVGWMNAMRTPEEVRLTAEHWAQKGATSIKLYASMKGDLMKAAIEHAHAHGLKAIAHIGASTYEQAIRAGIDEIFHGILVMSDLMPSGLDQIHYVEWYKALRTIDLGRPEYERVLALAAETKTVLTPTMAVLDEFDPLSEFMVRQKPYYSAAAWESLLKKRGQKPLLEGTEELAALNRRFVKDAYAAGCILTTGTDKTNVVPLPGFSLWQEMEAFSRAGLPPMAVLKAATWNGAYALGVTDLLGSITPGRLADLVVLDKNPLESVSHIQSVHRVIKAGIVYNPEDLLKRMIGRIG